MHDERSPKSAPKQPLCPSCAQIMPLARATSRFNDLPELYTFECRACGVSHIDSALLLASPRERIAREAQLIDRA